MCLQVFVEYHVVVMYLVTTFAFFETKTPEWLQCWNNTLTLYLSRLRCSCNESERNHDFQPKVACKMENRHYPVFPEEARRSATAVWNTVTKRPWDIGCSQDVWCWIFPFNGLLCVAAILGGRELCGRLRTYVFPSQRASKE